MAATMPLPEDEEPASTTAPEVDPAPRPDAKAHALAWLERQLEWEDQLARLRRAAPDRA